jgi:hypothetical protein
VIYCSVTPAFRSSLCDRDVLLMKECANFSDLPSGCLLVWPAWNCFDDDADDNNAREHASPFQVFFGVCGP